jgi:hypothetical protein
LIPPNQPRMRKKRSKPENGRIPADSHMLRPATDTAFSTGL